MPPRLLPAAAHSGADRRRGDCQHAAGAAAAQRAGHRGRRDGRALRDLCGSTPEEVRLGHAAPVYAGFRRAFGIPCVFDAEQTALVRSAETLAAPVWTADPVLPKRSSRIRSRATGRGASPAWRSRPGAC
ncbi:AraC family transcriptional regulator ligand-binding domain-containing protein [Roseomonas fluvialis]|uniref:AraC family transcriptional regulator ligand-binding domain-containing protein n=1 Tax=Roseomonas fluvialis TaxID=1750527 RepID=UPI003C6E836F